MRTIRHFVVALAITLGLVAVIAGSFGRNPYDTASSPAPTVSTAGGVPIDGNATRDRGERAFRRDLVALRRTVRKPDLSSNDLQPLVAALLADAQHDPARIGRMLHAWQRHPDGQFGNTLGIVLGLLDDPRIPSVALGEAQHARRRERRLAGLDLLDRVDSTDPAVVRSLGRLVTNERDPGLVGKAIFGLGQVSDDPNVRADVVAALEQGASNPDPEVRRRAVISLAEWAGDGSELATVVGALDDPSPAVRTAAAFAVGRTTHVTDDMRARVAAIVGNSAEDWSVRTIARNTIDRLGGREDVVSAFDEQYRAMLALMPGGVAPTVSE